jgi:hypothetical protein
MAARPMNMLEWIEANEVVVWWMLATSIATFLATLIGAPLWVINIRSDYFAEKTHKHKRLFNLDMTAALLAIGRNLLGGILVLVGVSMLVLPGQGLLTILVGIMLMDVPGKYRIARSIVSHPPVLHSMNWLRRRAGREPLVLGD